MQYFIIESFLSHLYIKYKKLKFEFQKMDLFIESCMTFSSFKKYCIVIDINKVSNLLIIKMMYHVTINFLNTKIINFSHKLI
jgi:hypothetical protein